MIFYYCTLCNELYYLKEGNSFTFMELFYKFKGLIYERRKSSQIWEPFCKLEDIIYERKYI